MFPDLDIVFLASTFLSKKVCLLTYFPVFLSACHVSNLLSRLSFFVIILQDLWSSVLNHDFEMDLIYNKFWWCLEDAREECWFEGDVAKTPICTLLPWFPIMTDLPTVCKFNVIGHYRKQERKVSQVGETLFSQLNWYLISI